MFPSCTTAKHKHIKLRRSSIIVPRHTIQRDSVICCISIVPSGLFKRLPRLGRNQALSILLANSSAKSVSDYSPCRGIFSLLRKIGSSHRHELLAKRKGPFFNEVTSSLPMNGNRLLCVASFNALGLDSPLELNRYIDTSFQFHTLFGVYGVRLCSLNAFVKLAVTKYLYRYYRIAHMLSGAQKKCKKMQKMNRIHRRSQ